MKNIEHICKLYSSPVTAKSLRKPAEEAFRAGEKYYSLNNAIIQESPREILNIARREIYKIQNNVKYGIVQRKELCETKEVLLDALQHAFISGMVYAKTNKTVQTTTLKKSEYAQAI